MTSPFGEATLPRGLLSDHAYDLVRRSILDGRLQPGARIVESEIARQLGVSQAPVREAVKRLVHEGLVTSMPRRGSYVTQISAGEADDAREVRGLLEEAAAREAVQNFDATARRELEALVDGMREAAGGNDLAAFRGYDMAFHRRVVELSGNSYLPRLWGVMEPSLLSLRIVGDPGFTGSWAEMAEAHQNLVELLASGNRGRAAAGFLSHATGLESHT
ncbi:GntR family transcriptional regulator [Sphaerisporangium melleum]|uniref:GntR family transcriptional regulator n=1 Tax=Sphaerisporangium melleum TaxID=321316 RepID=A0A917VLR1_9ACTN|nr:GntR family transcriptional regulator [Sphaerisporangium melleum]GGK93834.1 GntR family transcriptional regulator [Sphaerisporangium melleum]GII73372.1 GntR family transcriptional regulator [Sphaerisporangium melleum]